MKKLCLTVFLICGILSSIFAGVGTATGTLVVGTSNTATLDFNVALDKVNTYKIGFSNMPVTSFSEVSADHLLTATQSLIIDDGAFTAHLKENSVYVFWQIQSDRGCTVSLTAEDMDGTTGSLNVQLSTTPGTATSEVFNVDNGKAVEGNMTSSTSNTTGGEIFSFIPSAENRHQVVGSQAVSIVTENFQGRPAESFSGTMTLTITGV